MLIDYFPLMGLRLRTPRLELRLPSLEELGELAAVAADGIHDPAVMPFLTSWTDRPPEQVGLAVIQRHWQRLGSWTPEDWTLNLTVLHSGQAVGQQSIWARNLAVTREVGTGSWLGRRFHGKGIGTEMRAAVLHLAFEGLGAAEALSVAFADNVASLTVSRKLGYVPDGFGRQAIRGELSIEHRMRLTREAWERHRGTPVTVDGLPPCLPLFGLGH
jgi:RimJ/RimL family protein N-acetyltransferase